LELEVNRKREGEKTPGLSEISRRRSRPIGKNGNTVYCCQNIILKAEHAVAVMMHA